MNTREREGILKLVDAFTRIESPEESFKNAVDSICLLSRATFAGVFTYPQPDKVVWVNHNGPGNLADGLQSYGAKYPARSYILRNWAKLNCFKPTEIVGARAWEDSEFYSDFMKQQRFNDHALCFSPPKANGKRWLLSLCHEEKKAISKGTIKFISELMPFLVRGFENMNLLARVKDKPLSSREDYTAALRGGLTPREADVFVLMAHGSGNKEIARDLEISYDTARTHVQHIFSKLKVSSRIEALNAVRICR